MSYVRIKFLNLQLKVTFSMFFKYLLLVPTLMISLGSEARESPDCAGTISELKIMLNDQTFPLTWEETTMNDGKPLIVSIQENNGNLFLHFNKTREGLWAESSGIICQKGNDLETRFNREQVRVGPAAN